MTDGMDVVNKIKQCRTGYVAGHQDVPLDEVVINETVVTYPEDQ